MVRLAAVMAAVAVTAVSCIEDVPEGGRGIPVKFGVRTGALPLTRTAYSGETSNEGGTTRERINWQNGDRITIISPDARVYDMSTNPYGLKMSTTGANAHARGGYEVSKVNVDPYDNAVHHAGINPIKADARPQDEDGDGEGLQFPESGIPGNFRFFAMYPAKSNLDIAPAILQEGGVSIEWDSSKQLTGMPDGAAVLKAKLLNSQSSPSTTYTTNPDMRFAYMYADTVMRVESADNIPDVELSFKPMITTFQFAVRRDSETTGTVKLHRLEIVSNTCALCGDFEAELFVSGTGGTFKDAVRYTVPAYRKDGNDHVVFYLDFGSGNGIELQQNKDTKITIFVVPKGNAYKTPRADGSTTITDLTVKFYTTIDGDRLGTSLALRPAEGTAYGSNITLSNNGFIEFPAGKKINISGLTVPKQIDDWRFSVEVGDFIDEASDVVAVTPVQVREWRYENGGILDKHGDLFHLGLSRGDISFTSEESLVDQLRDLVITSYYDNGGGYTPMEWKVDYSSDGTNWYDAPAAAGIDWLSVKTEDNSSLSPGGAGSYSGEQRQINIGMNVSSTNPPNVRVNEGDDIIYTLRSAAPKGTGSSAPHDLSRHNIYGQPNGAYSAGTQDVKGIKASGPHTANSYIVSAPGWYCFPIVYGNAVDASRGTGAGYDNSRAWQSYMTTPFSNADGNPIGSSYILSDPNLDKSDPAQTTDRVLDNFEAVVLWQDVAPGYEVLRDADIEVVTRDAVGGTLNCPYVRFYIPGGSAAQVDGGYLPGGILPCNIVIMLRDKNKDENGGGAPTDARLRKILWSWHIWVTPVPHQNPADYFTIRDVISTTLTRNTSGIVGLLNCNMGWTPPLGFKAGDGPVKREGYIRFSHTAPGSTAAPQIIKISQDAGKGYAGDGGTSHSCVYYQKGRKDPLLPMRTAEPSQNRYLSMKNTKDKNWATDAVIIYGELNSGEEIRAPHKFNRFKNPDRPRDGTNMNISSNRPDAWNLLRYNLPKETESLHTAAALDMGSQGYGYYTDYTDDLVLFNAEKGVYDPCPPGFCVPYLNALTFFHLNYSTHAEYEAGVGWHFTLTEDGSGPKDWLIPVVGFRSNQTGIGQYFGHDPSYGAAHYESLWTSAAGPRLPDYSVPRYYEAPKYGTGKATYNYVWETSGALEYDPTRCQLSRPMNGDGNLKSRGNSVRPMVEP